MDGVSIPTNLILRFLTNQRDALGCIPVEKKTPSVKNVSNLSITVIIKLFRVVNLCKKKISFYKFLYLLRTFFSSEYDNSH